MDFRHSDHASVCEIHWGIGVLAEKLPARRGLCLEIKRTAEDSLAVPNGQGLQGRWKFPEEVHGFCHDRLASEEWGPKLFEALHRPWVVDV